MHIREHIQAARRTKNPTATYHQKRLDKSKDGESILDFTDTSGFLLHVIPQDTFTASTDYRFDLDNVDPQTIALPGNPYSRVGATTGSGGTATGKLIQRTIEEDGEQRVNLYTHVSTTGIIEAGGSQIARGDRQNDDERVSSSSLEARIVVAVQSYTRFLSENEESGPFEIHFSMFGMNGVRFIYQAERGAFGGNKPFTSHIVEPYPTTVDEVESDIAMQSELRSLLNGIWHAAGYNSPRTIDQNGDWKLEDGY